MPRNLSYEGKEKYVQFGCISSSDGDTLAYAKQASEASSITISDSCCVCAKHVQAKLPFTVDPNSIMIAFNKKQYQKLAKTQCKFRAKVEFHIQELYFNILCSSLNNLPNEVIQKLNPSKEVFSSYKPEEFFPVSKPLFKNIELDAHAQISALYLILKSSPDLPVLIAGSFGTGKTRLLARAAFEILKRRNCRVLICAHHQSSVDTFVNYFGEMKHVKNNKFWAINMIRVIPNDSYQSSTRELYKDYNIFRSKYDLAMKDLINCQLVLTTFNTAASLFQKLQPNEVQRQGFFTDILIDEGAQVREPEMVGALAWAGAQTKLVIAGDHYQVSSYLKALMML